MFSTTLSPWGLLAAAILCIDSAVAQNRFPLSGKGIRIFTQQRLIFVFIGVKTGVNAQTGYRPPRREINDLQKDVPQLYALL